jgi:hypothetical protein
MISKHCRPLQLISRSFEAQHMEVADLRYLFDQNGWEALGPCSRFSSADLDMLCFNCEVIVTVEPDQISRSCDEEGTIVLHAACIMHATCRGKRSIIELSFNASTRDLLRSLARARFAFDRPLIRDAEDLEARVF